MNTNRNKSAAARPPRAAPARKKTKPPRKAPVPGQRAAARALKSFSKAAVSRRPDVAEAPRREPGILVARMAGGDLRGLKRVLSMSDHDSVGMSAAYAYAMTTGPMAPMTFNRDGELCIQYRHPLIVIDADPRPTVFSTSYNPADPATCPFVASMLLPYTQHRVERIRFGYLGLVPTSTSGTVVLTASLSDSMTMPSDLVGALSYQGATSCPVWGLTWTDWMQVTPAMPPQGYDTTSLWRPNSVLSTLKDGELIAPPDPQVNYQVLVDGTNFAATVARVGVLWCEVKLWARRVKVAPQSVLAMHEDEAAVLNATTAPGVNLDCYANATQNDTIIGAFGAAPSGAGFIGATNPSTSGGVNAILTNGSATFTVPDDYLSTINFDSDWTNTTGTLDLADDPFVATVSSAQNWDYLPYRLRQQIQPDEAKWYSLEHGDSYLDVAILGVADGITVYYIDPESQSLGEDAHHVHRKLSGLLHKRDPDAPDAVGDILSKLWGVARAGASAAAAIGTSIANTATLVASQAANVVGGTILKSVFDVATGVPTSFFHTLSRADAPRKLKHINAAVVIRNPADNAEGGSIPGPTLHSTSGFSGGARSTPPGPAVPRNPFQRERGDAPHAHNDAATNAAAPTAGENSDGDGWVPVPQTPQLPPSTELQNALLSAHAQLAAGPKVTAPPRNRK